jgi:hypothetical protein
MAGNESGCKGKIHGISTPTWENAAGSKNFGMTRRYP